MFLNAMVSYNQHNGIEQLRITPVVCGTTYLSKAKIWAGPNGGDTLNRYIVPIGSR